MCRTNSLPRLILVVTIIEKQSEDIPRFFS